MNQAREKHTTKKNAHGAVDSGRPAQDTTARGLIGTAAVGSAGGGQVIGADGLDPHDEGERPWTVRMSITSAGPDHGGMTSARLRSLPVAFPFDPVVPQAFGISRSAAYRALAAGQLPITPLRIGRKLIVRRADLLAALGISEAEHGGE